MPFAGTSQNIASRYEKPGSPWGVDAPGNVVASQIASSTRQLPAHARVCNRALLLRTLYQQGPSSRADLSRSSGLTKASVSEVLRDLLAKNLILEVGARSEVRRGKPAMMLEFNDGLYQLIGIDLSDSTIFRGAVVDLRGTLLHQRQVEINGSQGEEALGKLIQLVKSLRDELTTPLLGLGVGVPGVVSTDGIVLNAPILGWHDLDLRSMLQEVFDCPVVLGNDANVAAFAEYTYGGGAEDMILIRIGVGVSMGILLDGKPILGSRSAAGEIRHITVGIESERVCGCGRTGCLETWLSTRNLFEDLAAAKDATEHEAVLTAAGQALGATLAPIVAALNTSEIVLSGPTQIVEGLFSATVTRSICDRTLTSRSGNVAVRLSMLGDDVVLRGATALVMSNELGITRNQK